MSDEDIPWGDTVNKRSGTIHWWGAREAGWSVHWDRGERGTNVIYAGFEVRK